MKKTITRDVKRTLALMMATLLLLTAWVFVTPQKAKAATADTGTKQLKIVYSWSSEKDMDGMSGLTATVTYDKAQLGGNGTGTASASLSMTSCGSNESGTQTLTANVAGYPTSISWSASMQNNSSAYGSKKVTFTVSSATLAGVTISAGNATLTTNASGTGGGSSTRTTTSTVTCGNSSVSSVSLSVSPTSLTIPTSGTSAITATAYAKDKFGWRLATSKAGTPTITASDMTGTTGGSVSTSGTYDTKAFSVGTGAKMNGNTNSKTVTVTATYGTKSASATYVLNDPSFTRSFNGNGGTLMNNSASFTTQYGNSAEDAGKGVPTIGKRDGYNFIGMYSTRKSDNYGSTEVTTSTSGYTGNITKDTALNYYNDQTFYAAWWAQNVNVTYINNDGSILKTSTTGKYDQPAKSTTYTGGNAPTGTPQFVRAPGETGTFDYQFVGWQVVSAKKLVANNDGTQSQIDYSSLVGGLYTDDATILKGDTVFQAYYRIASTNSYDVNYYDGSTTPVHSDSLGYKATATNYTQTKASDNTYSYTFKGWAVRSLTTDTQYIYDGETGLFTDGANHTVITNFTVYDDMNLVAVYERNYIDYTVNFVYTEAGDSSNTLLADHQQTLHYGDTITVPTEGVYNDAYEHNGHPLGYVGKVENAANNKFGYSYYFTGWNTTPAATVTGNVTYTAQYEEVASVYTIQFIDYDDTVLNAGDTSFDHGTSFATEKASADANVTATWRDDDNEYTFLGWNTDKDATTALETISTTATDNRTYYAIYSASPLYTVTYMDGDNELGTWKGTTDDVIPVNPTVIDPVTAEDTGTPLFAEPEKEDDLYATNYTFCGWGPAAYEAKGFVADDDVTVSSGSSINVPEGGTTVYAQFTRTPIDYEINFVYYDQTDAAVEDHKTTYEYGDEIVGPTEDDLYLFETVDGERTRIHSYQDTKYYYTFSSWDVTPSATVTGNATYTANYRKSYVYYDVTWLYQNGEQVGGKDFRVEKYIYGERIRAPFSTPAIITDDPANDPLLPELPDSTYTYAFDQWILAKKVNNKWQPQCDDDDNVIPFNAGTHIEAGVSYTYLPTYKAVADLKTLTILDEDGTTVLGTMEIGVGEKILDYVSTPDAKNPDDTYHYVFDKWIYNGTDTAVGATDTITADTTIKAVYQREIHSYTFYQTKTAPTFDEAGVATFICDTPGCRHTHDANIPALSDTTIPDVRLYVKNTSWDSTDPTTLTPLNENAIPIAPNSLLIANSADSAEASTYYVKKTDLDVVKTALASTDNADDYATVTYNAAGIGSQVNEIWAYYTEVGTAYTLAGLADVPDATDENPDGWHQIFQRSYDDETGKWGAEEANHSDTFASFEPAIEDGHQYVVYLKAIDAKRNINYVSSDRLGYDTTAPEVTLTSDNGSNEAATKFCLDTTIVLTEAGLTVTLDGSAIDMNTVTVTDEDENTVTTYEYTLDTVGKHTIRVTDAAGNETMKAFEIVGAHNPVTTYKAKTCTLNGWTRNVCTLCGQTIGDVDVIPATGHSLTHHEAVEATCAREGRIEYWSCSRCDKLFSDAEATTEVTKSNLATPKTTDHVWDAGKINKAANCAQNGIITYTCTRCTLTETITGDSLDVTATGYDAATAAAILAKHPDLAITTDVETTDPETGDPIITKEPVQATDTFGNPAYVQKTENGEPKFTETVATDEDGHTIYNADGTKAYLPDYDTTQPIYSYTIVHNNISHSYKVEKQTTAPTCEGKGEITHQCRYCGLKFHVSDVDPLGHDFTADEADEAAWAVGEDPSCTTDGWKYPAVCARCGDPNTEHLNPVAIPALGHSYSETDRRETYKDEENVWHNGYVEYTCSRCGNSYQEVLVPGVEYTYTFMADGVQVGTTLTKRPGEQITLAEVPADPTKASTDTTRYIFEGWFDGETEAVFPMIISQETGNKTFTAKFREETIYYTITFYEEDGTTNYAISGFKTYGQEFTQAGPEKASDATFDYTFVGWVALDAGADATPITTIKVRGDASYKAKYNATARKYSVAWVIDGAAVKVEPEVTSGTTLQQLYDGYDADGPIKNPTKASDETYHYTFDRWNPALTTAVSGNMQVVAKFTKEAHNYNSGAEVQAASCERGKIVRYTCEDCGFYYEKTEGRAIGHDYSIEVSRVNPTANADGYKIMKCSRCGNETRVELPRIFLTVTVKDNNHNAVSGVTVQVYNTDAEGGAFVNSGVTGSDGVAKILVPEAKKYKIVIEGKSAEVTVDGNGNITSGTVPTVDRNNGGNSGSSGCDCTCHKSGFWPMIFRFFHKIIKLLTGEFRCCPDANY